MKKKILTIATILLFLIASFLFATGFEKNPNVFLVDYSISEDGSEMTLTTAVASSMGYVRDFKDNGGGVKPHYLTFYSTFGGFNSSLGSKNVFTLELAPDDTEVYFNRADGGYELVLVKDKETGHWITLGEQFKENWGVTLTAENATPTGLLLKCTQSGGNPTGDLQTGSWFMLENWTEEHGWKEVDYLPMEYDLAWTMEAWIIPMNDTCEWEVNWEWLYGQLPEGKYRIAKEIMDFRETGDYDQLIHYAEFEIK